MPVFINIMYIYIIPLLLSCLMFFSKPFTLSFITPGNTTNKHFLFPMVLRFFS